MHRPVHQDWSYPKGKLEEGETFEEAAQREVLEETGLVCRLLRFVGHTDYIDRKGRPKVVAYWVMSAVAGTFALNEEVDELRWLDVAPRPASCSPTNATGSSWPWWRPMTSSNPWFDARQKLLPFRCLKIAGIGNTPLQRSSA